MKITKVLSALAVCACSMSVLTSCGKKEVIENKSEISEDVMGQIRNLGFTTVGAQKVEGGVRVEGDILLTDEVLNSTPDAKLLRVGQDEQYRTTNLVQRLPRTLTVKLIGSFPSAYVSAVDEAIRRYNAENLQLHFTRITSTATADLPITSANLGAGVLGQSGGFPSNGNPAPGFKLSPSVINSTNVNYIATIMAHEMGHCIGLRHTDYFNRAYSCGGSASNEGASTVGAILIPGTPSGADPNSWMLACVGNGVSRPFNTNDKTALNYLY
ncbi:M57 family metalloprotease [Hymenobacter persicinus]|uniref:Protease n=1 Tax=Hymenobacter persicinus TaxID=2025506 RepID=A0A4Q5L8Z5_9BACT|nr:M57 family metalloprotease [Hymenobacter persicinus]RYU77938.1 protease [Hymenobacter persicinus]